MTYDMKFSHVVAALKQRRPGNEASNVEFIYLSNSMWTTTPGQSPSQNRRYWALMGGQWEMEVRG